MRNLNNDQKRKDPPAQPGVRYAHLLMMAVSGLILSAGVRSREHRLKRSLTGEQLRHSPSDGVTTLCGTETFESPMNALPPRSPAVSPPMLAIPRNISKRHLAEDNPRERLQQPKGVAQWAMNAIIPIENEQRCRQVVETVPVMIWVAGPDLLCTYFNPFWLAFTGRSLDAELGNGWAEGVHPADLDRCAAIYTEAFDTRKPFTMEYRLRRHDGEYRWILDAGVPRFAQGGSFAGYVGAAVDVTSQKTAEAALDDLGQKLIEAYEIERTHIGRELHDDIGQRIAVLRMDLDVLAQALPLSVTDLRARIQTMSDSTFNLAKDIQAMSHILHLSTSESFELASAAAGFCRELSEQHNVVIAFSSDSIPDHVPRDVGLCVFRVLQEAVNNTVKHARARHVSITLRGGEKQIQLDVIDDGIGFDPDAPRRSRGRGLVSMQERLNLVGGELRIESRPGAGATIRARVPLGRAEDPTATP